MSFKIKLIPADEHEREAIQNLARFYVYEMSRYCGFLKGWEVPENGLYECRDLGKYWIEPNHYPFLVKVDQEIAGFILINKRGTHSGVDWNMGEFFVVSKYQRKGIGTKLAESIFTLFPGSWEVAQIPENEGAVHFWKKVVERYTQGHFRKELVMIKEPVPHPMIVLSFKNK